MSDSNLTLKIGTRRSELALKQTSIVVSVLQQQFPKYEYKIVPLSTRGDEILDSALPLVGGKNLFTFELERELVENKIDMIVHSLKDVATEIQENTCIGAILKRDSRHDVVVISKRHSYRSLDELPPGRCLGVSVKNRRSFAAQASLKMRKRPLHEFHKLNFQNMSPCCVSIVGTSSLRRVSLLKYLYPHLNAKNIRGNLNTRLRKLDDGQQSNTIYDAIILAAAGIERLNMHDRISQCLLPSGWPYAVSQGIIAVQCRSTDHNIIRILNSITHLETLMEAIIERAMMRTLKGGCSVPVGVDCHVALSTHSSSANVSMKGFIYSLQSDKPPLTSYHSCTITIDSDHTDEAFNTVESIVIFGGTKMENVSEIGENIAKKLLENNAIHYIESAKNSLAKMNF